MTVQVFPNYDMEQENEVSCMNEAGTNSYQLWPDQVTTGLKTRCSLIRNTCTINKSFHNRHNK